MNLYRLHLKFAADSHGGSREEAINFCLENNFLAIGWSYLYKDNNIKNLNDYLNAVKHQSGEKSVKTFASLCINDLIWTRDLLGVYYLCRVISAPEIYNDYTREIGCIVKVQIHEVGTNVPGFIVSRFSQPLSGTIQRIKDETIIDYSMFLFNQKANQAVYSDIKKPNYDLCKMLHPLDLEELVIAYLQIKYDYYLSKNSVARGDTTIKIECELYPRNTNNNQSAVLQVKNGNGWADPDSFKEYVQMGKKVFLYFANQNYGDEIDGIVYIKTEELYEFAHVYKSLLPSCLQFWIEFCNM